jgi:hypothetical protein
LWRGVGQDEIMGVKIVIYQANGSNDKIEQWRQGL